MFTPLKSLGIAQKRAVYLLPSDTLLNRKNPLRDWYEKRYTCVPGYWTPNRHWMELPKWVSEVSRYIPMNHSHELVVDEPTVYDPSYRQETVKLPQGDQGIVLMSVLNRTEEWARRVVRDHPNTEFVWGGYIVPPTDLPNVVWCDRPSEVRKLFPNWSGGSGGVGQHLFHGMKTVIRLRMSRGCNYMCKFCTVPRGVRAEPANAIQRDVDCLGQRFGFAGGVKIGPEYQWVYLDDKTFGQAPNWKGLEGYLKHMASVQGHPVQAVVQTSPRMFRSHRATGLHSPSFMWDLYNQGVRMVELGIEHTEDKVLSRLGKPHRWRDIEKAVWSADKVGMVVVPYILMGLPGVDYGPVVRLVESGGLGKRVPWLYLNWLSVYPKMKGQIDGVHYRDPCDADELSPVKSWLSPGEQSEQSECARHLMDLVERNWPVPQVA